MNSHVHPSESFYQKPDDSSGLKCGDYSGVCYGSKDPRDSVKSLSSLGNDSDYLNNDNLAAQKKVGCASAIVKQVFHEQSNTNFVVPTNRRAYYHNSGNNSVAFNQFQHPYQQLQPTNHVVNHQIDHLAGHLNQPLHHQWAHPCQPISNNNNNNNNNAFQHQPPMNMSCLDNRFSVFKSNKYPDTPPDSGSEPYSPPNNSNAINSNTIISQSIVETSSSCQNKRSPCSSTPSTTTNPAPVQSFNDIRNIHPNFNPGYPHYLRHPQYMSPHGPHGPHHALHLPCAFPRPHFGMYGSMEVPKVSNTGEYFGHKEDMNSNYSSIHNAANQPPKKRKYQDSPQGTLGSVGQSHHGISLPIKHEPCPSEFNYGMQPEGSEDESFNCDYACDSAMFLDGSYRVITWSPHQQSKWAYLLDETGREVVVLNYRVDADKGFNFALPDESFVCQKKNHFQITVHVNVSLKPKFVRSSESSDVLENIDAFFLHFYGVKAESQNQTIKIEQSQSDRSKKVFNPVPIDLVPEEMNKVTVGRLHFSETTLNNMRKKGKPNPDQRYFQLVVALEAHCGEEVHMIAAHISDKIIVRASNPGQFENDMEVVWNKGKGSDVIYHTGRVGINTDNPDEALTVHGNVRVTGHVVAPSDVRAKMNIVELDTGEQLRNISQMKVYKYHFNEEFAEYAGLSDEEKIGAGVLAQEVFRILPDAVRETGDILLKNGQKIEKFLVVNKERIFMENVGAVKELCKVTDKLEDRINEMESMKRKLASFRKNPGGTWSLSRSCGSVVSGSFSSEKKSTTSSSTSNYHHHHHHHHRIHKDLKQGEESCSSATPPSSPLTPRPRTIWSSHVMQVVIISLIIIMAACLISITALYAVDRQATIEHTQKLFKTIGSFSNKTNSVQYTHFTPSPTKSSHLVPPFCLKNQAECPVVCCEMPPDNPSDDFVAPVFPSSTGPTAPHPWGVEYAASTKVWKKKHHNDINDVPLTYVKHKKQMSNRTKPKPYKHHLPKFSHVQHEESHPRLKRDVEDAMIPIIVGQMNVTLSQDFCATEDCKEMRGHNFSFNIPLSSRYPLAFITLQFMPSASGDDLSIEFCSETKQKSCEDLRDESIYGARKVDLYSWDLPVGFFFSSQYNMRVSRSQVEDLCTLSSPGKVQGYSTYRFNFFRSCDD